MTYVPKHSGLILRHVDDLAKYQLPTARSEFIEEQENFAKRVDNLIDKYKLPTVNSTSTVEKDNSTKKFDFAALKELFLTKGLDALINELKALKNSGVVDKINVKTDDSGKTTVSVEVNGIEYEFIGVKGETTTSPNTNTDTIETPSTEPPVSETVTDPRNGVFDLSGVPNLNSKVGDLTKTEFFTALSAMKEQLHTYIEEQLKKKGIKYDKKIVEKELNFLMTQLQRVLTKLSSKPSTTVKEAFERLVTYVNKDIENSEPEDRPSLLSAAAQTGVHGLGFEQSWISETSDRRLISTDEFFLSADEVELKKLLSSNKTIYILASSSEEDIKTYAQHMRHYIQAKYEFDDKEIDNIINTSMSSSKTISEFVEKCRTLAISEILKKDNTIAPAAQKCAGEAKNYDLKYIVGNNATIHTEFGIDKQGNIVFQEEATTGVYNRLKSKITMRLRDSGIYDTLGGSQVVSMLIQNAWIAAYNDFNSSKSNNATGFVMNVLEKFEAMMNKLTTNPEYIQVFAKHQSYGDTSLTDDLIHYNTKTTYGNDENIVYSGGTTVDSNGVVHLANKTDDPDYQATMNQLLTFVKNKYSTLPADTVTKVFRDAQQQAIKALNSNINDCPYGTGNNSGRVEDETKNWGGKDNRAGDKNTIHMDQLVQMTLYYFDKLLTAELIK